MRNELRELFRRSSLSNWHSAPGSAERNVA
jgi:hypothetical protein